MSAIGDRRGLYWGTIATLVSAGITAFIPYIYGRLVDIAVYGSYPIKVIIGIIFFWLILSLVSDGLNRWGNRKSYEIATDVTDNLMVDIFHHLLNLPLKFHKERKMGAVMRKISRGVDDLYNFIEQTVFSFLPSLISFAIAIVILSFVEWRLSLILIVASLTYVIVTFSYTQEIVEKQKIMNRGWEKAYGDLWDSILNVSAVKSATAEEFERKRNLRNFNSAGRIYKEWRSVWDKMNIWQRVVFTTSFVAVFGTGIMMLRKGLLTPGVFIMFVGYTSLLTSPLARLADQYRMSKTAMTAFKRAVKYYDIAPEKDSAVAKEIEDIKGNVVFENVNFGYKKQKAVVRNISFEVEVGESVALVGESGVGKTTLVDLVGRYYLPSRGRILIDGVDIRKIKLKSLRNQMAVVPQEVLLFNDTIKNNIRYGRTTATDEGVVAAAKVANAHEFIEGFPKKYDQLVGERGVKLSTGQKQRVAIARAILRNPKILILDEATSALDSASEKLVQEALRKLIKGRTTFIIAHRLSTIQHADKIIVLEKGKIAEMGTHQELMKNPKGIYRNFWELQTAIQSVR
jgi:subfamily B ATP-binding cassette protein MsbA